jgi:tetratricopeptide (TPR) repeat protein
LRLSYIAALVRDNEQSLFVDFGYMPQENETTKLFEQALAEQQQKNWNASLEAYQKLLDQGLAAMTNSQASVIYHNMSTVAFAKSDYLKAYTWSKKSLVLNPSNKLAHESFEVFSKKFEVPVIARQISSYDYLKQEAAKLPLDAWCILSLILIFVSLGLSLKTFVTHKKNQIAENFLSLSRWPIYSTLTITLLVISITYVRYLANEIPHAIIIAERAQVQTAPGENKPVIFEAQAGLELEVLKFDQGYFQIRYPGAFTGWINKSQLEILSLAFEQKH